MTHDRLLSANSHLREEVKALTEAAAAGVVTRAQLADNLSEAHKCLLWADRMSREIGQLYRNSGNTEAIRLTAAGYKAARDNIDIGPRRAVADSRDAWERGPKGDQ